jgi:Cd2+/Zn2+-exporting ATPase
MSSNDQKINTMPSGTERELRQKLFFVFGSAICLIIGAVVRWVYPERVEIAAGWSMIGALSTAIPIFGEVLEGIHHTKGDERSEFYINQFIMLAVLACIVTGQYVTGGIVGIILVVGHVLEERSMLGSNEAIDRLLNLSRVVARRLKSDGGIEEIDADLLKEGDTVRIRPGDAFPADGTVIAGCSTANQANITGESFPVEIATGCPVFAGTTNLTGMIDVTVTKAGDNTLLGKVKKIVEEAQASRAPIMRLTEEYARYYLPLIVLIAGFVLFFSHDIQRSISVLIVSVPCAFLLAGPTAMVAALASASRLGILVKSVRFFEAATEIDTVVFDKTGTLTTGRLQVIRVDSSRSVTKEELVALAAAVESHSSHPLAQAIVNYAKSTQVSIPSACDIAEDHGLGLAGRVKERAVLVGRSTWLAGRGIELPPVDEEPHLSALFVAVEGVYAGAIYLTDTLRAEAEDLRSQLGAVGIDRFVMLTGDRRGVAEAIAAKIGFVEFEADCLPAQKLEAVEKLKREDCNVLVVGDGVNDAPALAAGNLSIAMGALGSDVAIQTADIALMSNDLNRVAQFICLSSQTLRVVNQNMLCGVLFIGVSIVLSSAGFISPLAASFIHEFGAFFVIFNSARLLKFEGQPRMPRTGEEGAQTIIIRQAVQTA